MDDLRKRFEGVRVDHPEFGTPIAFWYAINGMRYSADIIRKSWNKLVDTEEYDQSDKNELIAYQIHYTMNGDDPYRIRAVQN